jgi:hypothetical protein
MRAEVVTTPLPQLNIAAGAALLAARGPAADAPTGMAAAPDAPTGMAEAAWAAGAAGLAAGESAADGAASATFRALAWSEDDTVGEEPVPYAGADYEYDPEATSARPPMAFLRDEEAEAPEEPLPWYRRPALIFGAAAVVALLAVGGLAYTLTSKSSGISPGESTTTAPPGQSSVQPASPGAPPTENTVTVTRSGSPGPQPAPPPPAPTTTAPPPTTTTTTPPTTTTTTTTTTRTTTTTPPTTTTQPPTTTTKPPTTSAAPPTTTVAPPTTTAGAAGQQASTAPTTQLTIPIPVSG